MGLASQGLTPNEKALFARMMGKSQHQVEELLRQVMDTRISSNPALVQTIAQDIRQKILNDPLLKKDAGIEEA
jgi:hypothetical protein